VRDELAKAKGQEVEVAPAGTSGTTTAPSVRRVERIDSTSTRAEIVTEIKQELQSEMGLLPVQLLRERRSSFVELYTADSAGRTNYGTAGYLGHGYFITVKHAVVALKD